MNGGKQKILIVDDSEMNRCILIDILGNEFETLEAENGAKAVETIRRLGMEIALVLLDIQMPVMDGFEVLAMMNKYHWIDDIPVIMISSEMGYTYVERAYELGVTDYISRPFDARVVRRRAVNTMMLYAKQKRLVSLVADQIYEKERSSSLMINILSHIVEFRNGESGLHVLHINTMTDLLMRELLRKTDRYDLKQSDIPLIATASALHDIGKIGISETILNKPGKLTPEEFEIMKTHSVLGANMLKGIPFEQQEPLVKTAYEICRWHHERYDGRGYPDGLKGDEIPISAQVVSLADVYDALTSKRVYKKAFSHEKSMEMILGGECGVFNPLLMECLKDCADVIRLELEVNSNGHKNMRDIRNITDEMIRHEELVASERTLKLLEYEKMKYRFYETMSQEILLEYSNQPPMLSLSEWGAKRLGLRETILNPERDERVLEVFGEDTVQEFTKKAESRGEEESIVQFDCEILIDGEKRWHRIVCQTMWQQEDKPVYVGTIGKAMDIHQEYIQIIDYKRMATRDALTGLTNHVHAREKIEKLLQESQGNKYALVLMDLDSFKAANDGYGHLFGDNVLKHVAKLLERGAGGKDIVARIGGDEFLIFTEYENDPQAVAQRIFDCVQSEYYNFAVSVSMGIAEAQSGEEYESLFRKADRALYQSKKRGRRQFCVYDDSMESVLSILSPIDEVEKTRK